jgi:hypothetical protein
MKPSNRNICSVETALQEQPKIFNPICVNVAFDVLLSMVDYAVNVIGVEIVVRLERVAIDHRSGFMWVLSLATQRLATQEPKAACSPAGK